MMDDASTLVGRVLDGTYEIVRPLARGGMGAIYEAVHARLAGKRYAIKVLHSIIASNEEVFRRFRREAEIASHLGHDHIVEVQDFNVTPDSVAYMVMEFLDGEDLAARIEREPLPLPHVVRIALQVASALGAAHAAGIVHRDLKPQNIFLTRRRGSDEFVKVLDFGISKMQDSSSVITRDQSLMGTPFYMSPEQAMGNVREVDARTDVFALGAIIWEMLTGEMAFAAPTIPGALYRVCHEEPRPVHELRGDVPASVSALLACAMAKDREARFSSAQQLAGELARLVGRPTAPNVEMGFMATALPSSASGSMVMAKTAAPISMIAMQSAAAQSQHPPARGSLVQARGSMVAAPRLVPTTMSNTAGQIGARSPGRRVAPWALVGIAGLLAGASVALFSWRDSAAPEPIEVAQRKDPSPTVEPIAEPIAKPVAAEPPPTKMAELDVVPLRFDIRPEGVDATVRIDGRPIDGVEIVQPRSTKAVRVTVTAQGRMSWTGDVIPDRDRVVTVELVAQRKSVRSKRAKRVVTRIEPVTEPRVEPPPMPPAPAAPQPPPPPPPAPPKKKGGTIFDD